MRRSAPLLVFVVAAGIGIFTSWTAYNSSVSAERSRFEVLSDDAVEAIRLRLTQHLSLLDATLSYFRVSNSIPNQLDFARFVSGLDTNGEYDGIQGIGFAKWIETGSESEAEIMVRRGYRIDREIWPETDQDFRTPIVLLEPADQRNSEALGFDMYSESTRREAMRDAINAKDARASAPVELVQEITADKQAGFLVYLPFWRQFAGAVPPRLEGFVYAPFRAGDLFSAAYEGVTRLPIFINAVDVTAPGNEIFLYSSTQLGDENEGKLKSERTLDVAGRTWQLEIFASPEFRREANRDLSLILGVVSFLLATALAVSANAQLKAAQTARELHAITHENLQQKELMLQEMKHRIKNSIARILAIARQTASGADSLTDFTETFSARMNAMANAQDMLTRDQWQRADLASLIWSELNQVFGEDEKRLMVEGPDVELDERGAQGIGLSVHELATNALKYGAMSRTDGKLSVLWALTTSGDLKVDWVERPGPLQEPDRKGFGTKLIDASIGGELGGSVVRNYSSEHLSITFEIPSSRFRIESDQLEVRPKKRRKLLRKA